MRVFAIGADLSQLSEFRDVFGMRAVGLIDPSSSVYNSWRVPNPTAPYPQDYIIDQAGVVQYWSDQFDPWEVIRTIDRLLATGVQERPPLRSPRRTLHASPNPARSTVVLSLAPRTSYPVPLLEVRDAAGRLVAQLAGTRDSGSIIWNLLDENGKRVSQGVYLARPVGGNAGCRFTVLD